MTLERCSKLWHQIINDESCIINKLETSLIDDARVVIYDRHMFRVQVTGVQLKTLERCSKLWRHFCDRPDNRKMFMLQAAADILE